MITPSFRCSQRRDFVVVEIYLPSIHCKISNAEFDITPFQFTFHCAPYYLRLQFQSRKEVQQLGTMSPTAAANKPEGLCEGKGERATYDLAQCTMTVYLPKAVDGEIFLHLDMPNLLLATHAQRKALLQEPKIEVLAETNDAQEDVSDWEEAGSDEEGEDNDDAAAGDELETEFTQLKIQKGDGKANDTIHVNNRPLTLPKANHGEEEEMRMATRLPGTDSSLLALEGGGAGADGWFGARGGESGKGEDDAEGGDSKKTLGGYGFNNEFTNVFEVMAKTDKALDTDYVKEVLDVANPDGKSRLDRRQERLLRETEDYDDAAFWGCVHEDLRDPTTELGELFEDIGGAAPGSAPTFVPWYIESFEQQLQSSGMSFVSLTASKKYRPTTAAEAAASLIPPSALPKFAIEEEGEETGSSRAQAATSGLIVAWEGNTGTVVEAGARAANPYAGKALDIVNEPTLAGNERLLAATATDATVNSGGESAASLVLSAKPVRTVGTAPASSPSHPTAPRLAIPTAPAAIAFSKEEAQMLQYIQPRAAPITPIPSSAGQVCALLVDLLCAFIFDYLTTQGDGSVESVWTVTKLSPSLSYLDQPRNVFEALVCFSRRVFIYPFVRHWALVHRVVRDVGVLLLSGPQATIKALLGLKHILDNTEHHHMLSKLYVNPMIAYLSGCMRNDGDAAAITQSLQRTAVEMHQCMNFEPSAGVADGSVVPPHIVDMLSDGMEMDDANTDETPAAQVAEEKAEEDAQVPATGAKGLVLNMLKESASKSKEQKAHLRQQQRMWGGAVQYEPLAPFTLGLPIDMDDE